MVWMRERKRFVSPEGSLGNPPSYAPHADRRRNPKGLLNSWRLFLSRLWTARHAHHIHSLLLDMIIHFVGRLKATCALTERGNCVLLPFAHTVASETAVTGVEDGCFPSALRWAPRNSHVRLLQLTVRDLESKSFQVYCRQKSNLPWIFIVTVVPAVRCEEKGRASQCDILR